VDTGGETYTTYTTDEYTTDGVVSSTTSSTTNAQHRGKRINGENTRNVKGGTLRTYRSFGENDEEEKWKKSLRRRDVERKYE
jgi:hypothetical protein